MSEYAVFEGQVGSVSSHECLDASAILATVTRVRIAKIVKVARIAGASRHSRLETEPKGQAAGNLNIPNNNYANSSIDKTSIYVIGISSRDTECAKAWINRSV